MGPREEVEKKNERNGSDDGLETYRKEGGRKENKQRGEIEKKESRKIMRNIYKHIIKSIG